MRKSKEMRKCDKLIDLFVNTSNEPRKLSTLTMKEEDSILERYLQNCLRNKELPEVCRLSRGCHEAVTPLVTVCWCNV